MTLTENEFDNNYTYNEAIISTEFDPESQSGMLETYGEDMAQIRKIQETAPKTIWSMVDSEDGDSMEIRSGMVYAGEFNIIYYVITNEEWSSEEVYIIGEFDNE